MNRLPFFILFILAFSSCHRSDNYIIPVNYENYYEGITSLTEKENQELGQRIMMDWHHNTIGKEIPDITIKKLNGTKLKLKKWLKRETILIFAGPHCGFGLEEVEKAFPAATQNMKEELKDIEILCLIELANDSDQQITVDYAKSLQDEYDNLFIIDHQEALKANLIACPTKYFIDKSQIVKHAQMGYTPDQKACEMIIRQGIELLRKE